jgi:molybdenum cofactor synthesis domain-containing protein
METMTTAPHAHRLGAKADTAASYGVAVLTVSTGVAAGEREDGGAPLIVEAVEGWGLELETQAVVPDDVNAITAALRTWASNSHIDLIITTGGTGMSPTDVTPEATCEVCDRHAPGIAEYLRSCGLAATPFAALSRGACGIAEQTLIINLPGSPSGVRDGLEALAPIITHTLEIVTGRSGGGR